MWEDFRTERGISVYLVADVYQDGTNVALVSGLVIDVPQLQEAPTFCDINACHYGTGTSTITINAWGPNPGDAVDISFNRTLNTVPGMATIIGSIVDVVTEDADLIRDFPLASYNELRALADEFENIADAFEAAGMHADLNFTFPPAPFFFLFEDAPLNQTDARLLAAGLRTAAASIDLGTGFQTINPSDSFASLRRQQRPGLHRHDRVAWVASHSVDRT